MRVHFELKYGADNIDQARSAANEQIAKFMNVAEAAVPAIVDVELKVSLHDLKDGDTIPEGDFAITAFGNIKHSIATP